MSRTNKYRKNTPIYADKGRKKRVEFYGRYADLLWFEHCLANNYKYEPLADDRLSTRDACKQPDCLTSGIPTELKMWNGWETGEFPSHLPMQVQSGSLWMRNEYEVGAYVLMNMDGTHAISVTFDIEPDRIVETRSLSHASGKTQAAQYSLNKCNQFTLAKINKELN
jgi:hypothetical protein